MKTARKSTAGNDGGPGDMDRQIEAALPHVVFDGWSRIALDAAAQDIGLTPSDVDRLCPGGPKDAVSAYIAWTDRRMIDALAGMDLSRMKVRERIILAVRTRLELVELEKEAIRRAMSAIAMPGAIDIGPKSLYRTVDAIWRAAGDTSTDFNFYTKRGLLAAVYSATLLYWLDDRSPGHEATWSFLDRRIADVMRIPKITGRLTGGLERFRAPAMRALDAFGRMRAGVPRASR